MAKRFEIAPAREEAIHSDQQAGYADGFPAGSTSILWVIGSAAAVLYGSLIPFSFDRATFDLTAALGRFRLGLAGAGTDDILTNLLIYIPLGLSVALCGMPRHITAGGRLARLLTAIAVGTCVSTLAEVIQTGISIRVPSLLDVVLNATGSGLGAVLGLSLYGAGHSLLRRGRSRWTQNPFSVLAPVLMIGLLCHGLLPFNFVTDTEGLHAAFNRARLDLFSLRAPHPGQPPFEPIVTQMIGLAWFACLGYVLYRSVRGRGWARAAASLSALKSGFILVMVIEMMQLFTAWHVFDLATIVLRCMGVVMGLWCALFLAMDEPTGKTSLLVVGDGIENDSTRAVQREAGREAARSIAKGFLVACLAFQVIMLVMANIDPSQTSAGNFALHRVRWIPMETLWHRSFLHATAEVAQIVVTFGVLAITSALLIRSKWRSGAWLIAGAMTLATATLVEVLQCCTPSRTPDTTGPVLALIAVAVAFRVNAMFAPTLQQAGSASNRRT